MRRMRRNIWLWTGFLGLALLASGAGLAQEAQQAAPAAAPPKLDSGDTAWMLTATGLVLLMTIPGLALFLRTSPP